MSFYISISSICLYGVNSQDLLLARISRSTIANISKLSYTKKKHVVLKWTNKANLPTRYLFSVSWVCLSVVYGKTISADVMKFYSRDHPELDMGRVGLGHNIFRLGWVGLGRVQCQKYEKL